MFEDKLNVDASSVHWKKLSKDFSKYTIVGVVFTIAYIFLMWLFVDVLGINTLVSSISVVAGLHVGKFVVYHEINFIHRQFSKYTAIQVTSALLNITGVWLMIDILHLSTVVASATVIAVLFVLRFVFFKITGLAVN